VATVKSVVEMAAPPRRSSILSYRNNPSSIQLGLGKKLRHSEKEEHDAYSFFGVTLGCHQECVLHVDLGWVTEVKRSKQAENR